MKLSEIYTQLTHGELSQLHIGGGEAGEISAANSDKVLSHVNMALAALHKRFLLREERIDVQLMAGRTTYPLHSKYAVMTRQSRELERPLLDTKDNPFLDNILKVERVLTDKGYELGLNDENDPYAIQTPSMSTLRVPVGIVTPTSETPSEYRTERLQVMYRANHPLLTEENGADFPEDCEVDLPYSHLEPLLLYIASRVHNPVGMSENYHAGDSYAMKYEQACQLLEQTNIRVDQMGQVDKNRRGGWV